MPQTGKSLSSQQAFVEAFLKLKQFEVLRKQTEKSLRCFAVLNRNKSAPNMPSILLGLLTDLLESVGEELGVEDGAVVSALITNLEAQIALLETEVPLLEKLAGSVI
jgi:hypothetical protein